MSVFTEDMMFDALYALEEGDDVLRIPEEITELPGDFSKAFDSDITFRELVIPSTVQKIGSILLSGYDQDKWHVEVFKKFTVSKDNPHYTDVDGVLFSKDLKRLISYPCGKAGDTYLVPDTVETIERYAFADNVNLRKIVLPDSVKRLESEAFFLCDKLARINLPESLEYIGGDCFCLSNTINRLIIPRSMKQIPASLLSNGGVVIISNNAAKLEYDCDPAEEILMPFSGPVIISKDNKEMAEFAEHYNFYYFEDCREDENGIIWGDDGKALVSFPTDWNTEDYELPDKVEKVYAGAFCGSTLKRFHSNHKVVVLTDCRRILGANFQIYNYRGGIERMDSDRIRLD